MKSKLREKRTLLILSLLFAIICIVFLLAFNTFGKTSSKEKTTTPTPTIYSTEDSDLSSFTDDTDNSFFGGDMPMVEPSSNVLGMSTQGNNNNQGSTTTPRRTTPRPTNRPNPTSAATSTPNPTGVPTQIPGVTVTNTPINTPPLGNPTIEIPNPNVQPLNLSRKLKFNNNLKGTLADNPQVDIENTGTTGVKKVLIKFRSNDLPLAEVTADFSVNRDWSSINSGKSGDKAFVHGLVQQAGAASSYTLYVPIPFGRTSDKVAICPGANSLEQVSESCNNLVIKTLNDPGVSQITTANGTFWKISGLTGTGGLSLLVPFEVNDTLDRLKVNTASNHLINFGTINGLLLATDSLVADFGTAWDFGALSVSDIDLLDDGSNVTLAASAGVNTWGVDIDAINGTLTFSPPASGTGYIAAASIIQLKIGNNAVSGGTGSVQIINPLTANTYTIDLTITNAEDTEEASITIPIVDSDQVNVSSYINTFINFDIDTAIDQADNCDFDSCLTHENGTFGANYTVDLGELNSTWINVSNSNSPLHSEGGTGIINSIYFDITTNAANGLIVTVQSLGGELTGPGGNFIPSVTNDGDPITANSGQYGFTLPDTATGNGTINRNSGCAVSTDYCRLITTPITVFDSDSLPIDTGRVRMDIAAAASYINNPGTYTDTLTFVAVSNF